MPCRASMPRSASITWDKTGRPSSNIPARRLFVACEWPNDLTATATSPEFLYAAPSSRKATPAACDKFRPPLETPSQSSSQRFPAYPCLLRLLTFAPPRPWKDGRYPFLPSFRRISFYASGNAPRRASRRTSITRRGSRRHDRRVRPIQIYMPALARRDISSNISKPT